MSKRVGRRRDWTYVLARFFVIGPWTVLQSGEWSGSLVANMMQNVAT